MPDLDDSLLALTRIPSVGNWRRLIARLAERRARGGVDEALVRHLDAALADWPDALRVAPHRWLPPLFATHRPGPVLEELLLARTIDTRAYRRSTARGDELATLTASPYAANITTLCLRPPEFEDLSAIVPALLRLPAVCHLTLAGGEAVLGGPRVDAATFARDFAPAWSAIAQAPLASLRMQGIYLHPTAAAILHDGTFRPRVLAFEGMDLRPQSLVPLAGAALFDTLEELAIPRPHRSVRDDTLIALLSSPRPRLKALNLEQWHLDVPGFAHLARPDLLPGLRSLDLGWIYLNDQEAASLGAAPFIPALERLSITLCPAVAAGLPSWPLARLRAVVVREVDGLSALLAHPGAARLEELTIQNGTLSGAHVAALVNSAARGTLRTLRLPVEVEAKELKALLAPEWPALENLTIPSRLGVVGCRALAGARLPQLRSLTLDRTEPGKGLERLLLGLAAAAPRLESLSLNEARGGDAMCAWLAASGLALRELRLAACRIGAAGAVALAASPSLQGLTQMELSHNDLGNDGVAALAGLTALEMLTLEGVGADDPGFAALTALPELYFLYADGNRVTRAGLAALAGAGLVQLSLQDNAITLDSENVQQALPGRAFAPLEWLALAIVRGAAQQHLGDVGEALFYQDLSGILHVRVTGGRLDRT